jgi:multidrug efflux pump subunit AcrA (membrane-fusion protein)
LKQPRSNRLAAGVSIVVFACFALAGCTPAKKAGPPPPPLVLVSPAVRQDVSLYIEAVASLDGYINAEIRARVKGYLQDAELQGRRAGQAGQTCSSPSSQPTT